MLIYSRESKQGKLVNFGVFGYIDHSTFLKLVHTLYSLQGLYNISTFIRYIRNWEQLLLLL